MDIRKISRGNLASAIATRQTDPNFTSMLTVLPNPDPVLRKMNRGQEVFSGISMDAHVLGELRSIRAGLLGFEWRVKAGGDRPGDVRAHELVESFMANRPAPGMHWPDVIWNIAEAVFRGYSVHEVIWERSGNYLMPAEMLDRPQRRFVFSNENELRLKTRQNPLEGEPLEPMKWLLTRHMPSQKNPYGVAVFSACFWPYTFKHSGYRFFVKFAEKYGLPWAIGKYPQGTGQEEQDALADALAQMIEDAVAAVPEGSVVELIESAKGGETVHERLINSCNREMSKALTSQTLATEIQGEGSRAASETHRGREQDVNESDRAAIAATFNELFEWITHLNVPDASPPRFEFYTEAEARKEWVEVLDGARNFVEVPTRFAHERLQIPQPSDGEAVLPGSADSSSPNGRFNHRSCDECGDRNEFAMADFPDQVELEKMLDSVDNAELQEQAEALLEPLFILVRKHSPDEALGLLAEAYSDMDSRRLEDLMLRILFVADTWGRLNG